MHLPKVWKAVSLFLPQTNLQVSLFCRPFLRWPLHSTTAYLCCWPQSFSCCDLSPSVPTCLPLRPSVMAASSLPWIIQLTALLKEAPHRGGGLFLWVSIHCASCGLFTTQPDATQDIHQRGDRLGTILCGSLWLEFLSGL